MAKKPRSHKHSTKQRNPKPKAENIFSRKRGLRTQLIAGVIAFALLAGGSLAQWRATTAPSVPDKAVTSTASLPEVPARPASDSVDELPPEPPMVYPSTAGYNAYTSGGLPPGALPPGVSLPGLTMTQGYGVDDGIRQKFTGKERDNETGLDYFGARYYSSTQGRFTSPDELQSSSREFALLGKGHPTKQALPYADLTNPQTLNKYAYANNNPLRYVDQDGHAGIETAIDVISFAHSFYELIRNPSWAALGYVVWDGAAAVVPFAPGSWVAKIGKHGYSGLKAQGIVNKLDDFETVVNNKFIREGVGLVGQGDESVRRALNMGDIKAADFVGVKQGGEYVIAETKGSNLGDAVQQLNNTANALVAKVGDVKFSAEVVLRQGQRLQGDFKVVGNQLHKWNAQAQTWDLQKACNKAITVRYEEVR